MLWTSDSQLRSTVLAISLLWSYLRKIWLIQLLSLKMPKKGQKAFEDFIPSRLLPMSTCSLWDPLKKLKLKTFSNWMKTTKVHLGDKVIKLHVEHELLGWFIIIQGSRPELVPKLEEIIGEYEIKVSDTTFHLCCRWLLLCPFWVLTRPVWCTL